MGLFDSKRSKSALAKDRKYFNKSEKHEVSYAKTFKRKKKTYSKFDKGGGVGDVKAIGRFTNGQRYEKHFNSLEEAMDDVATYSDKELDKESVYYYDKDGKSLFKTGGGVGEIKEEANLLISKAWSWYIKELGEKPSIEQVKGLALDEINNEKGDKFYIETMEWTLNDVKKLKSIVKNMSDEVVLSFKDNDYKYDNGGGVGDEKINHILIGLTEGLEHLQKKGVVDLKNNGWYIDAKKESKNKATTDHKILTLEGLTKTLEHLEREGKLELKNNGWYIDAKKVIKQHGIKYAKGGGVGSYKNHKVGDGVEVWKIGGKSKLGTIVGFEKDGTYIISYPDGSKSHTPKKYIANLSGGFPLMAKGGGVGEIVTKYAVFVQDESGSDENIAEEDSLDEARKIFENSKTNTDYARIEKIRYKNYDTDEQEAMDETDVIDSYFSEDDEMKKGGGVGNKKRKLKNLKKHKIMAKKAKGKKLLKAQKPSQKDKDTKSKPTGYRWKTTQLKKKKDGEESAVAKKLHFKRPTKAEIEKFKKNPDGTYDDAKKQIYHERRADRTHSDDNLKKKYEGGGNVVEISKQELWDALGREPKYPSDFLNGKKYTKCFLRPYYKLVD